MTVQRRVEKSLLIFDFDGTIADTLSVAVDIINDLGAEFGYRNISSEELVSFRSKTVPELLSLSGLSWFQLPLFIKRARDRFKASLPVVQPIEHMPEVLRELRKRGYRLGILTSNTREGVEAFLKLHQLLLFEFVEAPDYLFGKAQVIKHLLKFHQLPHHSVVMIGDEVRDLDAAHKAQIDSVAVSWGFNAENLLSENSRSSQPTVLIHDPQELLRLFPILPE